MVCYLPGTGVVGLALGALLWWAHRVIFAIVVVILRLGEFAGIALLATAAATAATLVVAFIAWTARLIRRRRAGRGACLTCPHPCQESQLAAPVALPWPAGQPDPALSRRP